MKYIKTFEESISKPEYPWRDIEIFINWIGKTYGDIMDKEGWLISLSLFEPKNFERGEMWQVQRCDADNIIESDLVAEVLAKKLGLMVDDDGIIIGYKGVSFIEHPEELEVYKNIIKYNL